MTTDRVCVIGAGTSGLAACRALKARDVPFDCYEKASHVGGGWRYMNDNGVSPTYESLRANTSRKAMQISTMKISTLPLPESVAEFPHHSEVLAYLEDYADHFALRENIAFQTEVTAVEQRDPGWRVTLGDGADRMYAAVIVANGHNWDPRWPDFPGQFSGEVIHSRDYRVPDRFAGKRMLVVGFGSSGAEIACELSRAADRTYLSCRRPTHVVPRRVWRVPFDHLQTATSSRFPWPLQRSMAQAILRLARGDQGRFGVPRPDHPLLHHQPTISCDLLPALECGDVQLKPNVAALQDASVRFVDGSIEEIDAIVYATGYRVSFPFLSQNLLELDGDGGIPLYRGIVHPDVGALYFVGLIDPVGALLPIVEAQAEWVAGVVDGDIQLPAREELWLGVDDDARRLRKRFADAGRYPLLRPSYPYLRTLAGDHGHERGRGEKRERRSRRRASK